MAATTGMQSLLQSAVQSVRWTYSLFWQLCPTQGRLVWSDGYYNGAIKTRKTVQATEVTTEEASLHRSQQIRELYESLSAAAAEDSNGGSGHQPAARRPSAALSPEDLTESEWFYLMCISFSFPPGVGLPGKAYAKQHHIWLIGANEVESKVFSRAILAKSARIQTVVCIPLLDGVVELGTTERVKEDCEFIKNIKSHFMEHHHHHHHHPKPALSGHSSSEPPHQFYSSPLMPSPHHHVEEEDNEDGDDEEEEGEEEEDDDDDENEATELESDADVISPENQSEHFMAEAEEEDEEQDVNVVVTNNNVGAAVAIAETNTASELMQIDMSESIRLGTPDDASNDLDSDFHLLHQIPPQIHHFHQATQLEEASQEDTHYSETISSILRHYTTAISPDYRVHNSANSAFSRWNTAGGSACSSHRSVDGSSQCLLKYTLFTVPFLHAKNSHGVTISPSSKLCKATAQEEPNANHVLAERRRREKLNQRFVILRSLVPFVTKMDKASILGDTIEYVKQLRTRIQELEVARRHQPDVDPQPNTGGVTPNDLIPYVHKSGGAKTRMRPRLNKMETRGGGTAKDTEEDGRVQVEVSIIESDALVEMRCSYREGLILGVMQMLRELGLEITTVQSSVNGGILLAEFRAKLKESLKGRKASIWEVKKAIHCIIPRL